MKKLRRTCCIVLIAFSVLMTSALAATRDFTFTFINTGTQHSASTQKTNTANYATVRVEQSSSTYKYAVAAGRYTDYVTNWYTKTGTGNFTIPYLSGKKPAYGDYLYLHCATVSDNGTSVVKGNWTP